MPEIKTAYKLCATRQTNLGNEDYAIKIFDNLPEAKKKFFEYVEDFVIGTMIAKNRKIKIEKGEPLIISSPKYGFEIEPGNGITLINMKTSEPKNYLYLDEDFELNADTEIEGWIQKLEEKYKNARYDEKHDKIIY